MESSLVHSRLKASVVKEMHPYIVEKILCFLLFIIIQIKSRKHLKLFIIFYPSIRCNFQGVGLKSGTDFHLLHP